MSVYSFSIHSATGAPEDKNPIAVLLAKFTDKALTSFVEDHFSQWLANNDEYLDFVTATLEANEVLEDVLEELREGIESQNLLLKISLVSNAVDFTLVINSESEAKAFIAVLQDYFFIDYIRGNYNISKLDKAGVIPHLWRSKLGLSN